MIRSKRETPSEFRHLQGLAAVNTTVGPKSCTASSLSPNGCHWVSTHVLQGACGEGVGGGTLIKAALGSHSN